MSRSNAPARSWLDRLADPSEKVLAWMLLTPAIVFILAIVAYPVSTLLWNSFHDVRLLTAQGARFVGIENFALVMSDAQFWRAVAVGSGSRLT